VSKKHAPYSKQEQALPLFQAIIEDGVVCLQHDDKVEPALWKEVAAVKVHDIPAHIQLIL